MYASTTRSTLSRLRDVLLSAFEESPRTWVAAGVEVNKSAARRLLNLNETEETAYFVSGQGSQGAFAVPYDGSTFVGVGAALSRRFEGSGRFREAEDFIRATFADLTIPHELVPLVRFFGGASFSPGRDISGNCWSEFGDARFMLPRFLYVDDESQPAQAATLVCIACKADLDATLSLGERLLIEIGAQRLISTSSVRPFTLRREESEGLASWTKLVESIQSEIGNGKVQKVVAARRVTLQLSEAPRPADILERMNESAPLCARFCLRVGKKTFIGATPERLVQRNGKNVTTEALAGSISATAKNAGTALLESEKDQREHAYVLGAIQESLAPLCDEFRAPEKPELRRLKSIYHLRTPIECTLRDEVHILRLVERLHPTPAVGGMPRERAIEFINSHEGTERGWYAAPVGWVDAAGNGEFVVALRSGLIADDKVHVYAGAGIVEGSDSALEYAETELKLAGMLGALGLLSPAEQGASQSRQVRDARAHP